MTNNSPEGEVRLREYEQLSEGVRKAGLACLKYWRTNIKAEKKESIHSVVTIADTESETILLELLSGMYPGRSVMSEETRPDAPEESNFWVVDPIDGSADFEAGRKEWAIALAEVKDGQVATSIVYAPVFNEYYFARLGEGAFLNGQIIHVSSAGSLSESIVDIGQRVSREDDIGFDKRLRRVSQTIHTGGSSSLVYADLARGGISVAIQQEQAFWDIAPGQLLVQEAGGRFTNWEGNTDFIVTGKRIPQNNVLATNGILHETVLGLLPKQRR